MNAEFAAKAAIYAEMADDLHRKVEALSHLTDDKAILHGLEEELDAIDSACLSARFVADRALALLKQDEREKEATLKMFRESLEQMGCEKVGRQ